MRLKEAKYYVCYDDDDQRLMLSFNKRIPSWEEYGTPIFNLTPFDFKTALQWCRMMNDSYGFCYPIPEEEYE